MLTSSLRYSADGKVEFVIIGEQSRPDIDSYLHFNQVAADLIRRCVRGHASHWGGGALGLGKSPALRFEITH